MIHGIAVRNNEVIIEFEGSLKKSSTPSGPYTAVEGALSYIHFSLLILPSFYCRITNHFALIILGYSQNPKRPYLQV